MIKTLGAAIAAAACLASSAFASVLTIGGGIATVTCSPSCDGITGGSVLSSPSQGVYGGSAGVLSGTLADLYNFSPSNPSDEAAALNILTGGATSFTTGIQTDTGGVGQLSFSTTAQWIALKLGAGTFFLKNTGGPVSLLISYVQAAGQTGAGGGFSHYTEFGNVVPVPAAIWLMGAGIAGLGFAGRRRKTA